MENFPIETKTILFIGLNVDQAHLYKEMKCRFIIFILLLLPALTTAQQHAAGSLLRALDVAQTDSARVKALERLDDYYSESNRDSSLYYGNKALAIARKDNKLLDAAEILDGNAYELMHQGKYPESFQCSQEALKIAEDPGSENQSFFIDKKLTPKNARLELLASIHHDLGHLMGATNNIPGQIAQYLETRKIAAAINDKYGLALVDMNLGHTYENLNLLDSALLLSVAAAELFKENGTKKYLGNVYVNIGEVYLKKGNRAMALRYYHISLSTDIEQNNVSDIGLCYSDLADYYLTSRQADSSLFYSKKLLQLAQSVGTRELGKYYEDVYKSYQLNHQTDSAYKYQGLALAAQEISFKRKVKNLTDFQQLSFKGQLRLQQLEREKADTETLIRTYVFCAVIGVLLLLAFIFYRNYRQKQKANLILHEQKEEIETQRDSLGRTLEELKTTQNQLVQREKMASLGELTAGIAHEIQNPLNFVNNFSELSVELLGELKAESKKPKTERDEQLESDLVDDLIANEKKINHHGKRADLIVKGMLEHSRNSKGEKTLTNINILADEFFKLAYQGLRAKDKSFNAELITNFDPNLRNLNIVQQDIGRVLLNLFNNGFYAVNAKLKTAGADYKPTVEISTKVENDRVLIKVKDNGDGIPEAIKDKIMQPFFTTKPTGEGTGLGLSLSYDIVVKGHGGSITVDSKDGEFTTLIVNLPI